MASPGLLAVTSPAAAEPPPHAIEVADERTSAGLAGPYAMNAGPGADGAPLLRPAAGQACHIAASRRVARRDGTARSRASRSHAAAPVRDIRRDCRDEASMSRLARGRRSAS
jgi:hypothetical protein